MNALKPHLDAFTRFRMGFFVLRLAGMLLFTGPGSVASSAPLYLPEHLPNFCNHFLQVLETPVFDLGNPLMSIQNYLQQRATRKALENFDWNYYRLTKLALRDRIDPLPPKGLFEDHVAWFEVFLEKEVGPVFDFEEAIASLPQKNKDKLVAFFKSSPFSGPLSQEQTFDRVHEFFQIIDHEPIVASELFGENAVTARSALQSRAVAAQLTINGLNQLFPKLGYKSPKTWMTRVKSALNHPLLVATKVAVFNAGIFSGIPVVYLPKVKEISIGSEEINEVLLTGNAQALYESKIGQKIGKKLVKNIILRNIRRRVIEISTVLTVYWVAGSTWQTLVNRHTEIEKAQIAAVNQALQRLDDTNQALDEMIDQFGDLDGLQSEMK